MERSKYQTRQREEILNYFRDREGQSVTAGDIRDEFVRSGVPIGTATIYRQLETMVEEGVIARYVDAGGRSAYYEYLNPESHCTRPVCYHCKCSRCGRLIHIGCDELTAVMEHLKKEHGFEVDVYRTFIYGVCRECREKE